jgi:hypothetical protein
MIILGTTPLRNFIPDPSGPCPVCHHAWEKDTEDGLLSLVEMHRAYEAGYLRTIEIPGMIMSYQCPFCKTEWEV